MKRTKRSIVERLRADRKKCQQQNWIGYPRGLVSEAIKEIERLQHYADTCGGSDNDGRCPLKYMLSTSPE
jgi:hypothetical protein